MSTAGLVPGWPLAIFRIAFGLLYLDMALQKAPWNNYGWLQGFIEKEIAHPTFGFVAAFLQDVVLPNFALFGMLTFVTELGLGLGLLTGTLTRLAALARVPLAGEHRAPGLQRAGRMVLDLAAPDAAPVHVRRVRGGPRRRGGRRSCAARWSVPATRPGSASSVSPRDARDARLHRPAGAGGARHPVRGCCTRRRRCRSCRARASALGVASRGLSPAVRRLPRGRVAGSSPDPAARAADGPRWSATLADDPRLRAALPRDAAADAGLSLLGPLPVPLGRAGPARGHQPVPLPAGGSGARRAAGRPTSIRTSTARTRGRSTRPAPRGSSRWRRPRGADRAGVAVSWCWPSRRSTVALLLVLLRRLRVSPTAVLVYAWSPLVVFEGVQAGHLDLLVVPLVLLALLWRQTGASAPAGVALGVAVLVKLYPAALAVAWSARPGRGESAGGLAGWWRSRDWRFVAAVGGTVAARLRAARLGRRRRRPRLPARVPRSRPRTTTSACARS